MVRKLKYLVLSRLRSGVSVTPAVVKAIADHFDLVFSTGRRRIVAPLL